MIEANTAPIASRAIQQAEKRLLTLLPSIYRDRTDEVLPLSMGSAPLAFDVDGNVAWDRIWGSFCHLAMAGGPPHKGKLLEPGTEQSIREEPVRYAEVCKELSRGIGLASGLLAEQSYLPGWIRVRCDSPTMAEWLLRAITMENVSARLAGSSILLPAGPSFRLEKEIKNVITVAAKTAHYWSGHLIRLQQLGIANLLAQVAIEEPLLEPLWTRSVDDVSARETVRRTLEVRTGLPATSDAYAAWIGLECGTVSSAITTMRRVMTSNILCRREESVLFLPLNPVSDPDGERTARTVSQLLPNAENAS